MTAMFKPKLTIAVAMVLLTCTAAVVYRNQAVAPGSADTIFLLLPDSVNDRDIQVQVWLDAAAEEGSVPARKGTERNAGKTIAADPS